MSSTGLVAPKSTIVVGLDFGTHSSGFSHARSDGDPDALRRAHVNVVDRWPDQDVPYTKTRSAILYRGRVVQDWGWTAEKLFATLSNSEIQSEKFVLVENFKLLLVDGERGSSHGHALTSPTPSRPSSPETSTNIRLPAGLTPVRVIADFLHEMKKFIIHTLEDFYGKSSVDPDLIRWCLTVPAMWSDRQKQSMREAAERAGLVGHGSPRSESMLVVTLEPEAAAIAANHGALAPPPIADFRQSMANPRRLFPAGPSADADPTVLTQRKPLWGVQVEDGDVVLVVDCGGGTCDVTLHEVVRHGGLARLREAAVGEGDLCGSCYVDSAFELWARGQAGPDAWDAWVRDHPDERIVMMTRWEQYKRRFNPRPAASSSSSSDDFRGHTGPELFVYPPSLRNRRGRPSTWNLDPSVMLSTVFDPVLCQITQVMDKVLEDDRKLGGRCNKVLLVGGFGSSHLLQRRLREHLRERWPKLDGVLVVPNKPEAAVVHGAALFGLDAGCVAARRSRLAYGVGTCKAWSAEHERHLEDFGYPVKFSTPTGFQANLCIDWYVKKGELVAANHKVEHLFSPLDCAQRSATFKLFVTKDNERDQYVGCPGTRNVGEVVLPLPAGWSSGLNPSNLHAYWLSCCMKFGFTEIHITAVDARNCPVEGSISFAKDI